MACWQPVDQLFAYVCLWRAAALLKHNSAGLVCHTWLEQMWAVSMTGPLTRLAGADFPVVPVSSPREEADEEGVAGGAGELMTSADAQAAAMDLLGSDPEVSPPSTAPGACPAARTCLCCMAGSAHADCAGLAMAVCADCAGHVCGLLIHFISAFWLCFVLASDYPAAA